MSNYVIRQVYVNKSLNMKQVFLSSQIM